MTWNDDFTFADPPDEFYSPIQVHSPLQSPPTSGSMNVIERGVMNPAMEKFLSQSDGEPHVTVTSTQSEEWRFTKDKPQFADDGNVYRLQCLVSDPRKTRTVRVDELDHDEILSVNKKR